MSTGGPIESISYAGRTFAVAADADVNMKIGGLQGDTEMNGDQTGRKLISVVKWEVTNVALDIDIDNGDLEFLSERAKQKTFDDFSITFASGTVFSGQGSVAGELPYASANTTASVSFSGPGQLKKQG